MSAVADQTFTVDVTELRDVLVDIGALQHYLEDTLGDGNNTMHIGPIGRAGNIRYRLMRLLGLDEPDDAVLTKEREHERKGLLQPEERRKLSVQIARRRVDDRSRFEGRNTGLLNQQAVDPPAHFLKR